MKVTGAEPALSAERPVDRRVGGAGVLEDTGSLPVCAPSMESARDKRVVVGFFPVLCAEGDEFIKAHVRFDDGVVLHHVLDATVYTGDKFIVGGREIVRQDGAELWIVRLGAKENPRDRLSHGNTSVLGEEMKAGSTAITASTPNV